MPQRSTWLGRPWFLLAVAVLALNDHILKEVWPNWLTGKLSDFAGLAVVATVASVVLGHRWGIPVAGLGFVALKTLPGVAEVLAPLMGGGVTLRDPSDLLALAALPLLWPVLRRRPADRARTPRSWVVAGLLAALLTTTATSQSPEAIVTGLWYAGDSFYAEVRLGPGAYVRSADGGASWSGVESPPMPAEVDPTSIPKRESCAADGVCYRVGTYASLEPDGHGNERPTIERPTIERRSSPAEPWVMEWSTSETVVDYVAINPADSNQVAFLRSHRYVVHRAGPGVWSETDVIIAAGGGGPRSDTGLILTLVFLALFALGIAAGAVMLVVGLIQALVKVSASAIRARSHRGFDPPPGAR